ncbi:MAG TPA: M50 family metallopeptidase [Anaeromyxobacteraceae bacterium]|nr:M50 family metallopeptidase [Anaeromyxobacteraceae bacterium]
MLHLFGSSASPGLVVALVVVAFGALVIIHELGHFALARICGMRVERFSIGLGPVVLRRMRGNVEWAISAIPFGGYVKIAGMAADDDIERVDRGAYANQPAWRRFLVILAGPAMNYLFAVLLAAAMLASVGLREADPSPTVGGLVAAGAAEQAGLRTGDRILAVDDRSVATWDELVAEIVTRPRKPVKFSVRRGTSIINIVATPQGVSGRGRLGIEQASRIARASPPEALAMGFRFTNERAGDILSGLGQMLTGRQRAELRGPVGIAEEMAHSARAGAAHFVTLVWFISLALSLFNLLPVPALDGGRLVFLICEIVTRRRVNQRVESIVHLAGFLALVALIAAVTVFGDLARLFHR